MVMCIDYRSAPLTRTQVETYIDEYESILSKLCGSDGVRASDLLKNDAILRARATFFDEQYTVAMETIVQLTEQHERDQARIKELEQRRYEVWEEAACIVLGERTVPDADNDTKEISWFTMRSNLAAKLREQRDKEEG